MGEGSPDFLGLRALYCLCSQLRFKQNFKGLLVDGERGP